MGFSVLNSAGATARPRTEPSATGGFIPTDGRHWPGAGCVGVLEWARVARRDRLQAVETRGR